MSILAKKSKEELVDPATVYRASEKVGKARALLLLQQPFYGVLLSMIDFIHEPSFPTMATDGTKVFYNAKFVEECTTDELFGVILHEISHCIYLHMSTDRTMNREAHRWNVATDYAINLEIRDMITFKDDKTENNIFVGFTVGFRFNLSPRKTDRDETIDKIKTYLKNDD